MTIMELQTMKNMELQTMKNTELQTMKNKASVMNSQNN